MKRMTEEQAWEAFERAIDNMAKDPHNKYLTDSPKDRAQWCFEHGLPSDWVILRTEEAAHLAKTHRRLIVSVGEAMAILESLYKGTGPCACTEKSADYFCMLCEVKDWIAANGWVKILNQPAPTKKV